MSLSVDQVREAFRSRKIVVLVPTYNNEKTLAAVLQDVLKYTDQIIVVNDGSTDKTSAILEAFSITVVSYAKNQGKGFALRTGFKKAVELGYEYAITIDSDGQHFANDLSQFIEALPEHPNTIIIGARNMDQASVPGKSSFGHKFSNFWFWVETRLRMPDTQSGYRLYPIKLLEAISFVTRKFEFEIEVLVRASWRGIEVTSVPVKVFYADKSVRVSHFRPFTDFSRITVLNTVLVTMALLYIHPRDFIRGFSFKRFREVFREHILSPHQSNAMKALSIGFGVFIGIIPIWGFQSVTAIALAFAFRLNKALVILASNISFPPFIPFILYGSLMLGSQLQSEPLNLPALNEMTLDFAWQSLETYVMGSVVLAIITGTSLGLLTYVMLELTGKKEVPNQNVE